MENYFSYFHKILRHFCFLQEQAKVRKTEEETYAEHRTMPSRIA